ncbi:hypothetical protein JYT74_00955 [Crocinitomix catalasitica]|nr:hypothetical protein [Crocinitomix catalasitica]
MGVIFGYLLLFIGGIAAIIFAILANRLRQDVYFILGCIFTGLIIIYVIYNYKWIWNLLNNAEDVILGLIILSFIVIPVIFLVQTKQSKSSGENSEVTDAFLDDIIESEDEDINFDEDIQDDGDIEFEQEDII